MLRTSLFKKVVFLSALVGASLAHAGYEYRIPIHGVVLESEAPKRVGPSLVGDGVSKQGACETGISGCAVWNPADKGTNIVLSDGNLTAGHTGGSGWSSVRAIVGRDYGKWYWELSGLSNLGDTLVGIATAQMPLGDNLGTSYNSYGFNKPNPDRLRWAGASKLNFVSPANPTAGHVFGFALDMDNKELHVSVDGVWMGSANFGAVVTGLSGTVYPALQTNNGPIAANFGQSNFKYAVPAGYNAGLW